MGNPLFPCYLADHQCSELWLLDTVFVLLGPALWSMTCYGVRRGEKESRDRAGSWLLHSPCWLGEWVSLWPAVAHLVPPRPQSSCWRWHLQRGPGSAAFCGTTLGAKGAKCPMVLGATRWALSKPLFLANSTVLNLCAATLRLALGWTADALKKYLYKCDYVEVCVYLSVRVQPCQTHFISSVKISVEKKIQGFWSPMQDCVSSWVREEFGKTVSLRSCSPDPAISMSDMVCAVWLVIITRFALPFGKGRNKSRQCFTEDSIWLWKICATWLILRKGHQNCNCVPHERW